jgi:hypothetical protein
MGKVTTVGIDLAKEVFSVHAVDERGAVVAPGAGHAWGTLRGAAMPTCARS